MDQDVVDDESLLRKVLEGEGAVLSMQSISQRGQIGFHDRF